jgi:hypothetical protein
VKYLKKGGKKIIPDPNQYHIVIPACRQLFPSMDRQPISSKARNYHSELCRMELSTARVSGLFLVVTSGMDRKSSDGDGMGKWGES